MTTLPACVRAQVATLSIKELRAVISAAGLTTEGCLDKADLQQRATEAQAALAAAPANPASGGTDFENAPLLDALDALEKAVATSPPTQQAAETASACLERIVPALMEGESLPRQRTLNVMLGSMSFGLGGQGGLFTMSLLPLPFLLTNDDPEEGEDLHDMIEMAEEAHCCEFIATMLDGLGEYRSFPTRDGRQHSAAV